MVEVKTYSFELNPEMIDVLRREFEVGKIAAGFAEAIRGKKGADADAAAKKYFQGVGREWMARAIQIGDEYSDRTYEVLMEAIDHTGVYRFPFLLQRPIEIAYLGLMRIYTLPIVQNFYDRLTFRMVDCPVFKALTDKCGQTVAKKLPCQHACLTACHTVAQNFDIDVAVEMQGTTPKEGYCQFSITPI